jgi:hypothetical protein
MGSGMTRWTDRAIESCEAFSMFHDGPGNLQSRKLEDVVRAPPFPLIDPTGPVHGLVTMSKMKHPGKKQNLIAVHNSDVFASRPDGLRIIDQAIDPSKIIYRQPAKDSPSQMTAEIVVLWVHIVRA